MSIAPQPDPILRVTVGSPIYTSDDHKIGTVKERRANAFKVGTSLLQRDYWLAADTLASATANEPVVLRFERARLDDHKLKEPPRAP
jgi:hypothetical protein